MSSIRTLFAGSIATALVGWSLPAWPQDHDHAHHDMRPEQFAALREKVPLYQEFTDQQILDSMARMGPNFHVYLSDATLVGNIGVLALGHGYEPSGNEIFKKAYAPTATKHPTAVGLGMAMMSSAHIQAAVDELTAAGAEKLLIIPTTTLQTGGLIGQWQYVFGLQDDAPWIAVDRIETDAEVVFGKAPTTDPLISLILLEFALERSRDPEEEAVVLVSHGPVSAEDNLKELQALELHASRIRAGRDFAAVAGFTLQDDAPTAVRSANIDTLRGYVEASLVDGKRVIVLTTLPVKGSVQKKIMRDLDGLDYDFNQKGVMEHPLFRDWVEAQVASVQ